MGIVLKHCTKKTQPDFGFTPIKSGTRKRRSRVFILAARTRESAQSKHMTPVVETVAPVEPVKPVDIPLNTACIVQRVARAVGAAVWWRAPRRSPGLLHK